MAAAGVLRFLIKEFREALPPIAFFFVSFNLIELTTQLILADYMARLTNYMIATTTALVVGKAVLVADVLPFIRRFDTAPMVWPVLFKTIIYWAVVFLARLLEATDRILASRWCIRWFLGARSGGVLLASLRRDPDLDLRSLPGLHIRRRTESTAR